MAFSRKTSKSFLLRLAIIAPFVWFVIAIGLLFSMRRELFFRENPKPSADSDYVIREIENNGDSGEFPVRDLEYFYRPEIAINDDFVEHDGAAIKEELGQEQDARKINNNDLKLESGEDGAGNFENGNEEGVETKNKTIPEQLEYKLNIDIKPINLIRGPPRSRLRDPSLMLSDEDDTESEDNKDTYDEDYSENGETDEEEMSERRRVESLIRVNEKSNLKDVNVSWPAVPLTGLGEYGKSVNLTPKNEAEEKEKQEGMETHQFNQFVSDRISVIRNLQDVRLPECRNLTYRKNLPDTSVIIVFHNEAWTTLLRTVYSVLNRSPPHLLKEILLIDDFSDFDFLKLPLDAYMAQFEKVKIVHTLHREGLIRARMIGVSLATGKTLTFLDSHCECTIGWMEPLLDRVAQGWNHVVTPIIDTIDERSFSYRTAGRAYFAIGSFSWSMAFKWGTMTSAEKQRRANDAAPARSPTMAGGLFTINRKYFHHIGLYDPGMEIWGAENVELSFRIWMCGGTLEIIPCSRVGHVFRMINPNLAAIKGNPHQKNTLRLVETWLDDYKYLYYQSTGTYPKKSAVDIADRLELKKKLNCKPFSWYLKNIVPEMFDPKIALRSGLLQNDVQVNNHEYKCLAQDASIKNPAGNKLIVEMCKDTNLQIFYLTENSGLRQLEHCLEYTKYNNQVVLKVCRKGNEKQVWELTELNQIRHVASAKCLTMSLDGSRLTMEDCVNVPEQKWTWIDYRRVNT